MKLIIAEKPMLARAITAAIDGKAENQNGYTIKGDYAIVAAFGHLLTLKEPEDYDAARYKSWSLNALPIYFPDWGKKPGDGKEERLNLIGGLLKDAECVIHAGDPDDEGQYLIDEILQWFDYQGPVYRLATGDTTEAALKKALDHMRPNEEFVNSGWSAHARSVADIMVGFNFSRYFSLTNSHVKMLTVGRVQTPTLGLVVTRDEAIENHSKLAYYTIHADLKIAGQNVRAQFEPAKDDPNLDEGRITDEDYVNELVDSLKGREFSDIKIDVKPITEQPPLPFNLVKLQTYCSNKFGYDPSQVLAITQSLRDNHNAITYNRSDCQYLSEEQYKESPATVRQVMENLAADPAGKIFAKMPIDTSLHSAAFNDKNITAHTAIIPQRRRLDMGKLSEEERNVYLAIVKYFMAQFLPPAEKERTTMELPAEGGTLRAVSTKVLSEGFLKLIRPEKKTAAASKGNANKAAGATDAYGFDAGEETQTGEDQESQLSKIAAGTYQGTCTKAGFDAKETKAPPRYTKASLNEDMTRIAKYVTDPEAKRLLLAKDKEKKGENGSIGTSATRSSIIDNLEARGFIETRGKQIRSTVLGRELYRILPDELKKPDMTGLWWAVQEEIQDGEVPWTTLTDSVLEMIKKVVKTEYPKVDAYHVPESMRRGPLLLGPCPRCGADVIEGDRGYGCSAYRKGCKFVIWKTTKSGLMKNYDITPDMVHTLLTSQWDEEVRTEYKRRQSGEKMGEQFSLDTMSMARDAEIAAYREEIQAKKEASGEGSGDAGAATAGSNAALVQWGNDPTKLQTERNVYDAAGNRLDADGNPIKRRRSTATLYLKRLYSENTKRTYPGLVYLADEGPGSPYGASFSVQEIVNEPPKPLGKCPRCGCDVIEGKNGYGCTGYTEGCKFVIWKKAKSGMMSKSKVTRGVVRKLLRSEWIQELKPEGGWEAVKAAQEAAGQAAETLAAANVSPNSDVANLAGETATQAATQATETLAATNASPNSDVANLAGETATQAAVQAAETLAATNASPNSDVANQTAETAGQAAVQAAETLAATNASAAVKMVPTGRMRTAEVVHMRKLYSKTKDRTYTGDVYLCDEGPDSQYGASFGLDTVTNDGPEVLGICPRCGSNIIETRLGFGCENFKDGCKFSIWKNSKQKMLSKVTFTKTDAKKFLAGKPVRKSKLTDKKGLPFKADLFMVETPDNPYGPVFRVLEGTIEVKEDIGRPEDIKAETFKLEELQALIAEAQTTAATANATNVANTTNAANAADTGNVANVANTTNATATADTTYAANATNVAATTDAAATTAAADQK